MEIDSPPFLRNSASPKILFESLRELYNWTASYRDWANMEAQRLNAPENPFVPELGPEPTTRTGERFINLAVPDMFISWQMLRKIRENYDGIVRNFENEEDWNSDSCTYHRIHTIRVAALLLSVAFLDYERREAKYHDAMKASRKEFLSALKHAIGGLKKKLEGDGNNDEEVDFNNLFNSED